MVMIFFLLGAIFITEGDNNFISKSHMLFYSLIGTRQQKLAYLFPICESFQKYFLIHSIFGIHTVHAQTI